VALQLLTRLDAVKAVEQGRAPRSVLEGAEEELLPLEDGQQLYLKHVGRPPVLGGARKKTVQRYRAVLDKFCRFANGEGVQHWHAVSGQLLEAYGAWLDDEGYDSATEYLELTTIKQALKWLVSKGKIPSSCLVTLPLRKPQGTTTYCYTPAEVDAMIAHCAEHQKLAWLGQVITALVMTGLRISELADLRWTDIDFATNMIHLVDTSMRASKQGETRTLKTHRDRSLPIHPGLLRVLQSMSRNEDGRVYHGPLGGRLKPDTVRNVLIREVLTPLAKRFPTVTGTKGIRDGRIHSFRHFFCSVSANTGVPEQVLMAWLGHRDSKMVRRYYHLHQEEAQRQMAKITFIGKGAGQNAAG
jgi:integrase